METNKFIELCKKEIVSYYKEVLGIYTREDDVYVVWSCKTLQNNKALLSTCRPDTRYFECTYNGDKKELYFDSYVKEINKAINV